MAAVRMPTPGSPVPSSSMATTTVRTVSAPREGLAAARAMMRARSRFRLTARMPSRPTSTGWSLAGPVAAEGVVAQPHEQGGSPQRGARCHGEHHGHAGELQEQRCQQRTHHVAAASSSPRTTLALASSYPVWQSDGSKAEWAGR